VIDGGHLQGMARSIKGRISTSQEAVLDILPNPNIGTFTKEDGEMVPERTTR